MIDLRCITRVLSEQELAELDAWMKELAMFLPIPASDWACPAGHRRELLGEEGYRRLRCPICEGHDGNFLTEFDHDFLRDAGVRIQAE
jgi:hypothetical protein